MGRCLGASDSSVGADGPFLRFVIMSSTSPGRPCALGKVGEELVADPFAARRYAVGAADKVMCADVAQGVEDVLSSEGRLADGLLGQKLDDVGFSR